MSGSVPKIDLSLWRGSKAERAAVAGKMRDTCHNVGFLYLVNHGLEKVVCHDHLAAARAFFELDAEEKEKIHKHNSPQFRGWDPVGAELTNNIPDIREQYDFATEFPALENPEPDYLNLWGPNLWPAEEKLPGFKKAVLQYLDRMEALAREVLGLFSVSLGLPENCIEDFFGEHPMGYAKLVKYPPTPEGGSGVGLHKDSGFLTLLLQDNSGGLQILDRDGTYKDVPPVEGSFVVNIGETLQALTGNYYVATSHRVISPRTNKPRYSAPYFFTPDLRAPLRMLPVQREYLDAVEKSDFHRSAGFMPLKKSMAEADSPVSGQLGAETYGERLWDVWCRSHPEIVQKYYPEYA